MTPDMRQSGTHVLSTSADQLAFNRNSVFDCKLSPVGLSPVGLSPVGDNLQSETMFLQLNYPRSSTVIKVQFQMPSFRSKKVKCHLPPA